MSALVGTEAGFEPLDGVDAAVAVEALRSSLRTQVAIGGTATIHIELAAAHAVLRALNVPANVRPAPPPAEPAGARPFCWSSFAWGVSCTALLVVAVVAEILGL